MSFNYHEWSPSQFVCDTCRKANNKCIALCRQAFVYDSQLDTMDRLRCLIDEFNVKGLRRNQKRADFILSLPPDISELVGKLEA